MRLQITKSKNSECFYVVKSVRINGKNTNTVIEKLGNLEAVTKRAGDRDPYEWAKEYAAKLTEEEQNSSREIIVRYKQGNLLEKDVQQSFNGGYLYLQKMYYELGLDRTCRNISRRYDFDYNLNAILSRLIYGRILSPTSKLGTMEYSKTLLEKPDFELHQIYRALEVIAKETDYIQEELYRNSCNISKRNDKVLYYDVTNYYFEIEEADDKGLRQYGFSKEHRPNPLVQMGMFLDADGIPLAFCINPGNTNENITLRPLEKKIISDFGHAEFIVCTDAGLSSSDNRGFNSIQNRKFITVQSVRMFKAYLKEWALSKDGWKCDKLGGTFNLDDIDANSDRYYDEVFYKDQWYKDNGLEQRYIVTYSLKYKEYLKSLRSNQITRAEKAIEKGNIGRHRPTDFKRFIAETKCTDDGEVAEKSRYSINEEIVEYESAFDGFYAVATNLEDPVSEIIRINKQRWEIEESFRIMKTEFKSRPVYLSRDDRISAHFTTCFLALTLLRYIEKKKLNEKYGYGEIIRTLKGISFCRIKKDGYIPAYTRTNITDDLHEAMNFRTDYEVISPKNMKKIISESKKA